MNLFEHLMKENRKRTKQENKVPQKKVTESTKLLSSYSPDELTDLVNEYYWEYSPETHERIWNEIMDRFEDEALANDVLTSLEDNYHNGLICEDNLDECNLNESENSDEGTDFHSPVGKDAVIPDSYMDDYTNRLLVLKPESLAADYRYEEFQYFYATSGFGCAPDKLGTKVFGKFIYDDDGASFPRNAFYGIADESKLPEWARKKRLGVKVSEGKKLKEAPDTFGIPTDDEFYKGWNSTDMHNLEQWFKNHPEKDPKTVKSIINYVRYNIINKIDELKWWYVSPSESYISFETTFRGQTLDQISEKLENLGFRELDRDNFSVEFERGNIHAVIMGEGGDPDRYTPGEFDHIRFNLSVKDYSDTPIEESLSEDTVKKSNGKWTNRGDDGTEHGEFDTKKEADAQRKAMYANGYKGESIKLKEGVTVWSASEHAPGYYDWKFNRGGKDEYNHSPEYYDRNNFSDKYYGYFTIEHPTLGEFYISTGIDGDIRTDGKPWNWLQKSKYKLTQDQIDWVNNHKEELSKFTGVKTEIDESKKVVKEDITGEPLTSLENINGIPVIFRNDMGYGEIYYAAKYDSQIRDIAGEANELDDMSFDESEPAVNYCTDDYLDPDQIPEKEEELSRFASLLKCKPEDLLIVDSEGMSHAYNALVQASQVNESKKVVKESYLGLSLGQLRPFDRSDWDGYGSATKLGKEEPLIYNGNNFVIIIDGDPLDKVPSINKAQLYVELDSEDGSFMECEKGPMSLQKAIRTANQLISQYDNESFNMNDFIEELENSGFECEVY